MLTHNPRSSFACVALFLTMGSFRKTIADAAKKITGSSSKRSRASSSSSYTEQEESPMHEEVDHTEEQEEEHVHHAQEVEEEDEPHLDLERGRDIESYHLIKDRKFNHTPMYDADFLKAIGMDTEFISI
jgi:hypothetical protein